MDGYIYTDIAEFEADIPYIAKVLASHVQSRLPMSAWEEMVQEGLTAAFVHAQAHLGDEKCTRSICINRGWYGILDTLRKRVGRINAHGVRRGITMVSIESKFDDDGEDSSSALEDIFAEPDRYIEETLPNADRCVFILKRLRPQHHRLFQARYVDGRTLLDIGREFGVTESSTHIRCAAMESDLKSINYWSNQMSEAELEDHIEQAILALPLDKQYKLLKRLSIGLRGEGIGLRSVYRNADSIVASAFGTTTPTEHTGQCFGVSLDTSMRTPQLEPPVEDPVIRHAPATTEADVAVRQEAEVEIATSMPVDNTWLLPHVAHLNASTLIMLCMADGRKRTTPQMVLDIRGKFGVKVKAVTAAAALAGLQGAGNLVRLAKSPGESNANTYALGPAAYAPTITEAVRAYASDRGFIVVKELNDWLADKKVQFVAGSVYVTLRNLGWHSVNRGTWGPKEAGDTQGAAEVQYGV